MINVLYELVYFMLIHPIIMINVYMNRYILFIHI